MLRNCFDSYRLDKEGYQSGVNQINWSWQRVQLHGATKKPGFVNYFLDENWQDSSLEA